MDMNKVLQDKWLWWFMIENDTLWRRVIEAKCGTVDRE